MTEDQNQNKRKILYYLPFIVAVVLAFMAIFFLLKADSYKVEADYYKEQMLGFCDVTKLQEELIAGIDSAVAASITSVGECEDYLLGAEE